jgi:hypothetical protein
MKILITITILIFSFVAISTHADSLFEDAYLSDLHVVDVNQHTGWALIQDRMGNQRDVSVGDEIGWEQAVVVDIQKAAIIVEQEELKTRMPVVNPFAGN